MIIILKSKRAQIFWSQPLLLPLLLSSIIYIQMINLYRDPEGEHIFSNSNNQCPAAQPSVVFLNRVQCKGCQHLKTRVRTLEQLLAMVRWTFD